jgi:hypothetical protein
VARVLEGAPDDLRTRTGMALGTLPYMAPEQALGKRAEIDGRADLFALGATAFRILARRRVHEADSEAGLLLAMASKPAPPLASVAPHVPEGIAAIIDLALAFDRSARYPDARTMQADVQAATRAEAPPYVSALLGARDVATRHDMPAAVVPLPTAHPKTVVGAPGVVSPSFTPAASAVTATPPPVSVAVASVPAALPPSARATTSATAPQPEPQALPGWLLAAGAGGCLLLGVLLWFLLGGSAADTLQSEGADSIASGQAAVTGAAAARATLSAAEAKALEAAHKARERSEKEASKASEKAEKARQRGKRSAEERGRGKKGGKGKP